jgi:protein-S-isoprenylcysteine O-methyltransferase Ste14
MLQKTKSNQSKLNPPTVALIGVLLAFVLALVFIWMWYDVKNNMLEKQKPASSTIQSTR